MFKACILKRAISYSNKTIITRRSIHSYLKRDSIFEYSNSGGEEIANFYFWNACRATWDQGNLNRLVLCSKRCSHKKMGVGLSLSCTHTNKTHYLLCIRVECIDWVGSIFLSPRSFISFPAKCYLDPLRVNSALRSRIKTYFKVAKCSSKDE